MEISEGDIRRRYEAILRDEDFAPLRERLADVEDRLRFGRPDERDRPSLLAQELALERARGTAYRTTRNLPPPDLLLLTVGTSPEPLLFAAAHHAPRAVTLLMDESLGDDALATLAKMWDLLGIPAALPAFAILAQRTVRGGSPGFYRTVDREVADARAAGVERIVLDFSGAKKTMVAGAFLAAGMLDLDVTYVEFGAYDAVLRRPVAGTSRVELIRHPARLFRLRDEEQLAAAFDGRRFDEAARRARQLAEDAESAEVREVLRAEESDKRARWYRRLAAVAEAYGLWRQGFYRDAAEAFAELPELPSPPTVERLALAWPSRGDHHKAITDALEEDRVFTDPSTTLAYVLDLLAWYDEATAGAAPRDAYLRLYGAVESLFSYVLHAQLTAAPASLELVPGSGGSGDARVVDRRAVLRRLFTSSTSVLKLLAGREIRIEWDPAGEGGGDTSGDGGAGGPIAVTCRLVAPEALVKAARGVEKGRFGASAWGRFGTLRHKAAHWLAPVPPAMALDLRSFLREALRQLVPLAVAARLDAMAPEAGDEQRRLQAWRDRLLAAVDGSIPADLLPLSYREVRVRLETGVSHPALLEAAS